MALARGNRGALGVWPCLGREGAVRHQVAGLGGGLTASPGLPV